MAEPRLVVLAPNFAPNRGGVESLVVGLAAHAWPLTTTVVAPPTPGHSQWDEGAPFRVLRRELVDRHRPRWRAAWRAGRQLEAAADALLYAEWWPVAMVASRRRARPARILLVHGTEIVVTTSAAGRARLARTVGKMDLVIANSHFTADRLRDRVPGRLVVEVLNPGVDLDGTGADPEDLRRRLGLGPGPVVLTAARLVPRKGHREFARHWPEVTARVPGASWVVAGDGPCRAELAASAPPGSHVLGPVDDATLLGLYRLADVHLLPALPGLEVEGFGMVVTEAGAAGTPSVVTDLGGLAEAVGPGGVAVPAGDMAVLAAAVADLLADEERRRELGRLARRRAEELSWERTAARFRGLVEAAMANRAP